MSSKPGATRNSESQHRQAEWREPSLPHTRTNEDPAKLSLKEKAKRVWAATLASGEREEPLSHRERFASLFIHQTRGQLKGYSRGFLKWLSKFITPNSAVYRNPATEILDQIKGADEAAYEFLMEYMESDWERRGELTGEVTGEVVLWGLETYFFAKKFPLSIHRAISRF